MDQPPQTFDLMRHHGAKYLWVSLFKQIRLVGKLNPPVAPKSKIGLVLWFSKEVMTSLYIIMKAYNNIIISLHGALATFFDNVLALWILKLIKADLE